MCVLNLGIPCTVSNGIVVSTDDYINKLIAINPGTKFVVLSLKLKEYDAETLRCFGLADIYNKIESPKYDVTFIIDEIPEGLGAVGCSALEKHIKDCGKNCILFFKSVEDLDRYSITLDFTCFAEEDTNTGVWNLLYFEEDCERNITV